MGNKINLIEKIKICLLMFANLENQHFLTVTCEFCNGINILPKNCHYSESKNGDTITKKYESDYVCLNCYSEGHVVQTWNRMTPEAIAKIKQQLSK